MFGLNLWARPFLPLGPPNFPGLSGDPQMNAAAAMAAFGMQQALLAQLHGSPPGSNAAAAAALRRAEVASSGPLAFARHLQQQHQQQLQQQQQSSPRDKLCPQSDYPSPPSPRTPVYRHHSPDAPSLPPPPPSAAAAAAAAQYEDAASFYRAMALQHPLFRQAPFARSSSPPLSYGSDAGRRYPLHPQPVMVGRARSTDNKSPSPPLSRGARLLPAEPEYGNRPPTLWPSYSPALKRLRLSPSSDVMQHGKDTMTSHSHSDDDDGGRRSEDTVTSGQQHSSGAPDFLSFHRKSTPLTSPSLHHSEHGSPKHMRELSVTRALRQSRDDDITCPVCDVILSPGTFFDHLKHELEDLNISCREISFIARRHQMMVDVNGAAGDGQQQQPVSSSLSSRSRFETFLKIKGNREVRIAYGRSVRRKVMSEDKHNTSSLVRVECSSPRKQHLNDSVDEETVDIINSDEDVENKEQLKSETEDIAGSMKCVVCSGLLKNPVTSVRCWHVHCDTCWNKLLANGEEACPQCQAMTSSDDLRRLLF